MPLFVIYATDAENSAPVRAANRQAHLAYWGKLNEAGRMVFAGPLEASPGGAMVGSLLIFEAESLAEAEGLREGDPYVKAGLFAQASLHPLRQALPQPRA